MFHIVVPALFSTSNIIQQRHSYDFPNGLLPCSHRDQDGEAEEGTDQDHLRQHLPDGADCQYGFLSQQIVSDTRFRTTSYMAAQVVLVFSIRPYQWRLIFEDLKLSKPIELDPCMDMYGIYANIKGVYWWYMLPYTAYMDPSWEMMLGKTVLRTQIQIVLDIHGRFVGNLAASSITSSRLFTDAVGRCTERAHRQCWKLRSPRWSSAGWSIDPGRTLVNPYRKSPFVDGCSSLKST